MIGRMTKAKASWGSVRKLPSGRYQARYRVDGKMVGAPTTFRTKRDAEAYLSTVRADMERGPWVNPIAGKVTLREYSTKWLEQRPDLRPRTVELYEGELRLHILPVLGDLELAKITPTKVRDWHSALLRADKPGPTTVAKCYRLLHAILNTAVADELLVRNPCVIKGAGQEKAPERPIASIPQVFEIADTIEPRFRAMVLVGCVRRAASRRDAGAHPRADRPAARPHQGGRAVPGAEGRHARARPTEVRGRRPYRRHPGDAQARAGGAPRRRSPRRARRASCSAARTASRCAGRAGTRPGTGR